MIAPIVLLSILTAAVPDEPARPWSFDAIRDVRPPRVENAKLTRGAIDLFVLARLEAAGLEPAPVATREDLIRRLSFDLLGLPPTSAEIDAFVVDDSPDAWEQLVDRYLASPHFGERWGQHWLDVVRFAETEGFEYDRALPAMWRYRDWVIEAMNADLPFDQFVLEQVAGDELAGIDGDRDGDRDGDPLDAERARLLVAAGFHRLGPVRRNAGNQEVAGSRNEVLTERTDIIGAAILGVSIGCARCHDHKFDPITQEDYYSLQSFLGASREYNAPLVRPEDAAGYAEWKARTREINAEIAALKKAIPNAGGEEERRLKKRVEELKNRLPEPFPAISTIRNVPETRTIVHVLERGDWEKKRQAVRMRPPGSIAASSTLDASRQQSDSETEKPRTRLAKWLVSRNNPLTARVIANRVWQHHFGVGLVKTANDFGSNGEAPSHPLLLDHLATTLVESGWSLKILHREILRSSTYRQTSRRGTPARARQVDPDNRLLWRFNRRRLDAEEIRDSMLLVSGQLNRAFGGESVVLPVAKELVELLYDPEQWKVTRSPHERHRRSIYLFAKRNLRLPFMEVFDQPALQTSCAGRQSSTHAPQSLELLNGEISRELAAAFAARVRTEGSRDVVGHAFILALGRAPKRSERRLAERFLEQDSGGRGLDELALALFNLTSFLYVP